MNQRIIPWIGEIGAENLKLVSSKIYDFWLEDKEKAIDIAEEGRLMSLWASMI